MQGAMTTIIIAGYALPMGAALTWVRWTRSANILRRVWLVAAVVAVLIGLGRCEAPRVAPDAPRPVR